MIAEGFIANGANVYLVGREAAALDAAVAALSPVASRAGAAAPIAMPANLQELSACEELVRRLTADLEGRGGLHVLVNNAGAAWGAPLDEFPDAAWTKVLTLNLQRAFTLTQLCLPLLTAAGTPEDPARVIHIGSIDGIRAPIVDNYAYSASKAGLHQLSRHMARVLGPRAVTSNVLACGPFPTKMLKPMLDRMEDVILGEVPLGRVGAPEDAAGAALFLASKAGYVRD